MGRFSDVAPRWGARTVVAMDLSKAVQAAAQNLGDDDRAAFIQADAAAPPLEAAAFNIVFSIGVLHHTPSTVQSLACVAALVKPAARWRCGLLVPIAHDPSRVRGAAARHLPDVGGAAAACGFAVSCPSPIAFIDGCLLVEAAAGRVADVDASRSRVAHPRHVRLVLAPVSMEHSERGDGWFRPAFTDLWSGPIPRPRRRQRMAGPLLTARTTLQQIGCRQPPPRPHRGLSHLENRDQRRGDDPGDDRHDTYEREGHARDGEPELDVVVPRGGHLMLRTERRTDLIAATGARRASGQRVDAGAWNPRPARP